MRHGKRDPNVAKHRGIKFRLCRKISGFNLRRLADAAGCNLSLLSLLENGARDIGRTESEIVTKIAHELGLTHDEFMFLVCDREPEVDSTTDPAAVESDAIGGQS